MKYLLILLLATSCVPLCKLTKQPLVIIDYQKRTSTYTAKGLDCNCFCSFYGRPGLIKNDTINILQYKAGSVSANILPYATKINKYNYE